MTRRIRLLAGLGLIGLLGPLVACSAGSPAPRPAPSVAAGSSAPDASRSPTAVSLPTNGVTLAELGFVHGPRDAFSVPGTAVLTTRVDQPNTVTLVLAAPPPTDLFGYLQRALPAAGFRITAESREATTLAFAGRGWTGSFTAVDSSSAVVLRPT